MKLKPTITYIAALLFTCCFFVNNTGTPQNTAASKQSACLAPYMQADMENNFVYEVNENTVPLTELELCFEPETVLTKSQTQVLADFIAKLNTQDKFAAAALGLTEQTGISLQELNFDPAQNTIETIWNKDNEFVELKIFLNTQTQPTALFKTQQPAWKYKKHKTLISPVKYAGTGVVKMPDLGYADDFSSFANTNNIAVSRKGTVFRLLNPSPQQHKMVADFCANILPALMQTDIVIENIRQEFKQSYTMFSTDHENTAMNTHIKTNIMGLLYHIRGKVLDGKINPLKQVRRDLKDEAVAQADSVNSFSIASLTGNPPTWGHVSVWLSGLLINETDKTVVLSAGNRPDKPNTLHKDRRYTMIQMIQDKLWPLVEFSYNNEKNDPTIKGTRARLVEINPHAKRIVYVSGDDHIEDLPKSLDSYTTRFNVPKKPIEIHFISRTKPLGQLTQEVEDLKTKYPFRFRTTQTVFEGVSSSRFRKKKNASVPASVINFLPQKAELHFLDKATDQSALQVNLTVKNYAEKPVDIYAPGHLERFAEIVDAYTNGRFTLRMAFETFSLREAA